MNNGDEITLLVHTRNSQATLPRLLESTAWCDERIVVDMSSTDSTVEIADASGCRVIHVAAEPFRDVLRNRHLDEPACPWTLVLDSDEHLAADAEVNLRRIVSGLEPEVDAVRMPRFNTIAGRVMRGSGWYPDHQVRLFRTGAVEYESAHHRPPRLRDESRRMVTLEPPHCPHIHHENYTSLADFVERQMRYATSDTYETATDGFDFTEYLARAAAEFDTRHQPDHDGDLSYALALLMYWNQVIRGLIHWESLGRMPALPTDSPFPLAESTVAPVDVGPQEELRRRVQSLERELSRVLSSHSVRITAPLRAAGRVARRLRHRARKAGATVRP